MAAPPVFATVLDLPQRDLSEWWKRKWWEKADRTESHHWPEENLKAMKCISEEGLASQIHAVLTPNGFWHALQNHFFFFQELSVIHCTFFLSKVISGWRLVLFQCTWSYNSVVANKYKKFPNFPTWGSIKSYCILCNGSPAHQSIYFSAHLGLWPYSVDWRYTDMQMWFRTLWDFLSTENMD